MIPSGTVITVCTLATVEDIVHTEIPAKNMSIDRVMFANIHATTSTTLTVRICNNKSGVTGDILAGANMTPGSTIKMLGLELEPLDTIMAYAGDDNVVDVTLFFKEQIDVGQFIKQG